MIFKSRLNVAANPDIKLHLDARPVEFAMRGSGTLSVKTSPIHAEVGIVPVRVAMPFMRGRRVVLASFGPFHFTLKPITFAIQSAEIHTDGKFGGAEGIDAHVDVQGKCRAEIHAEGESDAKVVKATIEGVFNE
jgi:hypothetical protein